jgi:hypothetical protein
MHISDELPVGLPVNPRKSDITASESHMSVDPIPTTRNRITYHWYSEDLKTPIPVEDLREILDVGAAHCSHDFELTELFTDDLELINNSLKMLREITVQPDSENFDDRILHDFLENKLGTPQNQDIIFTRSEDVEGITVYGVVASADKW